MAPLLFDDKGQINLDTHSSDSEDTFQQDFERYTDERRQHWDRVAASLSDWKGAGRYYHRRLARIYQHLIPPGSRVLEIGCGPGDLLASVDPDPGVGIDFSPRMVQKAQEKYPQLRILEGDAHQLPVEEKFDFIILSDLLNDLWDVQQVLKEVRRLCLPSTRVIINLYSRLWEIPLAIAQRIKLAKPNLPQNWLTTEDLQQLLYLTDFEAIKSWPEIIFPLWIPALTPLLNRFAARFWPFKHLSLTNVTIARPVGQVPANQDLPSVSVIVPARNEEGNIEEIFQRVPEMGGGTQIIFVEGHSRDDTFQEIKTQQQRFPEKQTELYRQSGKGKGDAVRLGFEKASGDVLMILDADLTVPPEDLPRFYQALVSGKGEFINGVRLVYPMEDQAMRFLNLLGNKFFSQTFTWLLNQPIKDTLCGTKVLFSTAYQRIAKNRSYFGDFDPFGDFDLLFGATRLNLKIIDLPVRYRSRKYGDTNINRFQHGALLLRMVFFSARRLKFI